MKRIELSPRELEVYQMFGRGLSTKQVAADLGLDMKTVSTYTSRVCEKLGVYTPFMLKVQAYTNKGVPPPCTQLTDAPMLGREVKLDDIPRTAQGNPSWILELLRMKKGEKITVTGLSTERDVQRVQSATKEIVRRKLGVFRTRRRDATSYYVERAV